VSTRIFSFEPIADQNSEILILGSVPGRKSLEEQQYYAHPQNCFWKLMFELLKEDFTTDYTGRKALLKRHHIALWDVIDSCERRSSLDSDIRNEEHNGIADFLHQHPKIKAIFCNGQKSFHQLKKILPGNFGIPIIALPSTSPAHASLSYEEKKREWSRIICKEDQI